MFIPKILYAVDYRVNQWLLQCCRELSVKETTLELVSFADIIVKLQLNNFNCFLPMNIQRIIKDETSQKKREASQEGLKTKKENEVRECKHGEEWANKWRMEDQGERKLESDVQT